MTTIATQTDSTFNGMQNNQNFTHVTIVFQDFLSNSSFETPVSPRDTSRTFEPLNQENIAMVE